MISKKNSILSDNDIVRIILEEGKTEYFDILYQRYFRKVMDKCHSFLRDSVMAREFANEIFAKVFEKLSGFKGKASFSSWLYSITYNHCIEYLRLKKKLHYPEWNRENELPEIVDDPEESLAEIDYDKLMVIMDMIHPEEKALLLMKYQDNLPISDIQEALKVSESAAKMRLKRAKARVVYLYFKQYG